MPTIVATGMRPKNARFCRSRACSPIKDNVVQEQSRCGQSANPHPPYSPGISPCDFWPFSWSKHAIQGEEFHAPGHVRAFFFDLWHNLDPSMLISVYYDRIERLEEVIAMNGELNWK
jgi:hypothetical protein